MEGSTELQAVCDRSPMLTTIAREFEGLVKALWHFTQHNPQSDFAQLEERARHLSKQCFASALQSAAHMHRYIATSLQRRRRVAAGAQGL